MTDSLKQAYDSEIFRQNGHEIVDLLADYLKTSLHGKNKVINWKSPADQLAFWQKFDKEKHDIDLYSFFSLLIENSTHLHNPRNLAHQVSPVAPVAALADFVGALLNNSTAIYEIGGASSALEKIVTSILAKAIGYDENAGGFLTSGGSIANFTALLAARKSISTDIWEEGSDEPIAIMISEEAHYSVERAARILGLGTKGIIKVPTNENFQMRTGLLESLYETASQKGIKVFAIIAIAGSTSTGTYDNLNEISSFCRKHNLWLHIDGAHGGAAAFSEKYKFLTEGIQLADSVTIDCHKMMMTPALTSALIFKNEDLSYETFAQKAVYLWNKHSEKEWYNLGRRTLECTKLMMGIKTYSIIQAHGLQLFDDYITYTYDLGKVFAKQVREHPDFELATEPMANIICFRYKPNGVTEEKLNDLNTSIRNRLTENGDFYISQTQLRGKIYLRTTIMNPFSTEILLENLLKEVELIGNELI